MANLNGFNAGDFEPSRGTGPIPAGQYVAVIVASEMKLNKAGNGEYLQLTFEIIEGAHAHRKVWARLNLKNPNEMAVQIAMSQLSAICHSVGVLEPDDSVKLHNLPLLISVTCKKRTDTNAIVNEIGGYAKREPPANQAEATTRPSATPPWKRG